ncbi:hypothetical protein [Mycobacteroides abscessus]|uniref:hypothetical protein n=1 Tax=Mycobacteroides abscessus TaxID=36809 RepID=UPI0013F4DA24|nr:hypothetical protein [Mycobacteroides abscessus]
MKLGPRDDPLRLLVAAAYLAPEHQEQEEAAQDSQAAPEHQEQEEAAQDSRAVPEHQAP